MTAWVKDGKLIVRQQSDSQTEWLEVPDLIVTANQTYYLGVNSGDEGLKVWLNSEPAVAKPEFNQDIDANDSAPGEAQMLVLTEAVDPTLDNPARMAAIPEDQLPVLGAIHHGSETLKEILMGYGATVNGHLTDMPAMQMRTTGQTLSPAVRI